MQRIFTWFDGDLQIVKRGQVASCSVCQSPIPKIECYVYFRVENIRICKRCVKEIAKAFNWIEQNGIESPDFTSRDDEWKNLSMLKSVDRK